MRSQNRVLRSSIAIVLLTCTVSLWGLQQSSSESKTEAAQDQPVSTAPFQSQKQKQSYALGMNVANQFRRLAVELDPDLFVQGFRSSLSGEQTLITSQDASAVLKELRAGMKQRKAHPQPATPAPIVRKLRVAFKLDPRLNGPTYGGEVWVAPSVFSSSAQPGTEATVDARVQGVSDNGTPVEVAAEWTPADTDMVTVSPGQKSQVRIIAHRAGESKLTVAAQGASTELTVKAKALGSTTQLEITQK